MGEDVTDEVTVQGSGDSDTPSVAVLDPSPDSPQAQIQAMSEANQATLQSLHARSIGAPDVLLLQLRVDNLVDFLIGSSARLTFEAHYQQRLADFLSQWEAQATRAQLTAGIDVPLPFGNPA